MAANTANGMTAKRVIGVAPTDTLKHLPLVLSAKKISGVPLADGHTGKVLRSVSWPDIANAMAT